MFLTQNVEAKSDSLATTRDEMAENEKSFYMFRFTAEMFSALSCRFSSAAFQLRCACLAVHSFCRLFGFREFIRTETRIQQQQQRVRWLCKRVL